jgi:hypothetical protein
MTIDATDISRMIDRWLAATDTISNPNQFTKHPLYKAVLEAAGEDTGQLIDIFIVYLKNDPSMQVICALHDIVDDAPVIPDTHQGNVMATAQDWIEWYEEG